jgi:hypothetical protein
MDEKLHALDAIFCICLCLAVMIIEEKLGNKWQDSPIL